MRVDDPDKGSVFSLFELTRLLGLRKLPYPMLLHSFTFFTGCSILAGAF
jgi:hypothetical protein